MDQAQQKKISDEIDEKTSLGLAYKDAKMEWVSILGELWSAFGKPVDKKRIKIYERHLSNVPTGLLEQAVQLTIKNQDWDGAPTVHAVFKSLKKILYDPPDLDIAIIAWTEAGFNHCILDNFEIDSDYSLPVE